MQLALKVDVDTLKGMTEGVPALEDILAARGIRASFFAALGPDNSGRAVFRAFRQAGFLKKMVRTRAPSVYGFPTVLYGTLLPAPPIGPAARKVLPRLEAAGHEVGLHGYDHVRWHDRLLFMPRSEVEGEVRLAQTVFGEIFGREADSFAAPGWQASRVSREVLAQAGMLYASDTRGRGPYLPRFGEWVSPVPELPTTLPTLDELLGFCGLTAEEFYQLLLKRLNGKSTQVLTIHAELEGGPFKGPFSRFLDQCLERGVRFFRLRDWARELRQRPEDLPRLPIFQGHLPGRAGTVACQGAPEGPQ